jgi:uncharacterized protein
MRQIISSGSVKAISLERDEVLKKLREIAREASRTFSEIVEIRLFGSLASGTETGLSDADVFVLVQNGEENPVERMRPYFMFFSERLDIGLDMIVATTLEFKNFKEILAGSKLLYPAPLQE